MLGAVLEIGDGDDPVGAMLAVDPGVEAEGAAAAHDLDLVARTDTLSRHTPSP